MLLDILRRSDAHTVSVADMQADHLLHAGIWARKVGRGGDIEWPQRIFLASSSGMFSIGPALSMSRSQADANSVLGEAAGSLRSGFLLLHVLPAALHLSYLQNWMYTVLWKFLLVATACRSSL
jgi:hypothetical protein